MSWHIVKYNRYETPYIAMVYPMYPKICRRDTTDVSNKTCDELKVYAKAQAQ